MTIKERLCSFAIRLYNQTYDHETYFFLSYQHLVVTLHLYTCINQTSVFFYLLSINLFCISCVFNDSGWGKNLFTQLETIHKSFYN